ncbi:hypothetical protein [Komagataeibacter diospyri]|uniref:hypothetical protein n=1 Tax=Komagataeibacter diospyri TaxID=1932662 RepID=UPI001D04C1DC|nr:hypothetical protein [Komagataeibacter diospyri]
MPSLTRPTFPARPIPPRRVMHAAALAVGLILPGGMDATAHAASLTYPAPIMGTETTAHAWGIETRFAQTTPCVVEMTINQTTFIAHMPEMIQAGLFNTQVTPTLQRQAPHYLMNTLQMDVTPGFVHTLFTQRGAPARCHFAWSYIAPNGTPHPMVNFDVTRQAHDRIDWAHLRFGDMMTMAQNPVVDRQFDAQVNQETIDVTIALSRSGISADLPLPTTTAGTHSP